MGKCLDGSSAGYYIHKGSDLNNFLIYFQNGQLTVAQSLQKILLKALQISTTQSGSSKNWPQVLQITEGILSNEDQKNSYFSNWTKILIKGCDGSNFVGGRTKPINFKDNNIYFRAHHIVTNVFQQLQDSFNIFSQQKINLLVGGSGYGGQAALLWSDYLKNKVLGSLKLFADSSVYITTDGPQSIIYCKNLFKLAKFLFLDEQFPLQECSNVFDNQKCLLPQYFLLYISVPTFIIQSQYDPKSINLLSKVNCISGFSLKYCQEQQIQQIQFYRLVLGSLLGRICRQSGWGGWSIGCVEYDFTRYNLFFSNSYSIPMNQNKTAYKALIDWLQNKQLQQQFLSDLLPWPDNQPCSKI